MPFSDIPLNALCVFTISANGLFPHRFGTYTSSLAKRFHYHGFYPWFILGAVEIPPEEYIDVACMQHQYVNEAGEIVKHASPLCPEEWLRDLLKKGIMPLMAPSLQEYPLYDLAISWGSRIVNTDEPELMLAHLREKGLHT